MVSPSPRCSQEEETPYSSASPLEDEVALASEDWDLEGTRGPRGGGGDPAGPRTPTPPPLPLWDTDVCARPALFRTKQECKAKVEERSSSVTRHGRLSLQ